MNVSTKFYIQVPMLIPPFEYWKAHYDPTIIEGEDELEYIHKPYKFQSIKVLAPSSFSNNWPTVCKGGWMECPGPARELEYEEWVEYVHGLKPLIPLPKIYKAKHREIAHITTKNEENVSITLPNNYKVSKFALKTIMKNLKVVKEKSPFAFFDLVMKCRDNSHKFEKNPFEDCKITLKQFNLMQDDDTIDYTVKNIVLCTVTGEKFDLNLISPLKKVQ